MSQHDDPFCSFGYQFMNVNYFAICLLTVFSSLALRDAGATPIPAEDDRIGWSADGNRHDPDDWGATALALAIFAKQGWQDKLVHIDYNNWLLCEWQLVDWMKNSSCPEYRWVYSRLRKSAEHKDGCLDASDGGMPFVLATGDRDGNFSPKLRDFLGTGWEKPQKAGGQSVVNLANDQKKRQATEKFNQIHEVDQNVVAEFNRIKSDIKPSVPPTKARKLLVYAVSHGPHRFVIPTGSAILKMLGQETGAYTAVVSDDLAHFEPEALRQFDAVCFANTTGEVFYRPIARHAFQELSAEEKRRQVANAERLVKNLTDYVRDGGGFFGIHAATDTLKKSPAYGDMIGGYFNGHPWSGRQTVHVRIEQPEHPLCVNVFHGQGFFIKDEIYQMKDPYARDKLQVLLSVDLEKSDKPAKPIKRRDKDFPLSWVKAYGKGRVFYSALGHNKATFHNPLVLQHWLEGLQYVLGDKAVPYMQGKQVHPPIRDTFIVPGATIRHQDWKLLVKDQKPGGSDKGQGRTDRVPAPAGSLFNLKDDPGETTDLSRQYPEIVSQLRQRMEAAMAELNENTREIGKIDE